MVFTREGISKIYTGGTFETFRLWKSGRRFGILKKFSFWYGFIMILIGDIQYYQTEKLCMGHFLTLQTLSLRRKVTKISNLSKDSYIGYQKSINWKMWKRFTKTKPRAARNGAARKARFTHSGIRWYLERFDFFLTENQNTEENVSTVNWRGDRYYNHG